MTVWGRVLTQYEVYKSQINDLKLQGRAPAPGGATARSIENRPVGEQGVTAICRRGKPTYAGQLMSR
jgi:hypothetical protein